MHGPLADLAIAGAGLFAGTINVIVGSGTLLTFPVLLGLGYPPLVANVSNAVGLVPGSLSGALGYRRELTGQGHRALDLGLASAAGGCTGGVLLLVFPASFESVVPYLVLLAVAMVVVQPRLAAGFARRRRSPAVTPGWPLRLAVYLTGVYGGYFGAAQGVLLIGLMGLMLSEHLQRLNGLKNVLTAVVNGVAAVLFIALAPVAWVPAGILAGSSFVGGQVGALVGRRLPTPVLRGIIVAGGLAVAIKLLA